MPMSPTGFGFTAPPPPRRLPNIVGAPRWQDAYTVLLPVRLTAHTAYGFTLNGDPSHSFRSIWLVPATPFEYSFSTGGVADLRHSSIQQKRLNRESFNALVAALTRQNAHRDFRGVSWEKLFASHRQRILDQPDTTGWSRAVADMLVAAGDPNLQLELDGTAIPTFKPTVTPPPDDRFRADLLPGFRRISPNLATARTADQIAYLSLDAFPASLANPDSDVLRALADARTARAVIIDLRANTGTHPRSAESIARWFIRERAVYARYDLRRGPGLDDFSPKRDARIEPNPPDQRITAPVVLLIGPNNRNAAETFALMTRYAAQATLIGQPTFGAITTTLPVYLPNGLKLHLPAQRLYTPDDIPIETVGIVPDLLVPPDTDHDTALRRALEHLTDQLDNPHHP